MVPDLAVPLILRVFMVVMFRNLAGGLQFFARALDDGNSIIRVFSEFRQLSGVRMASCVCKRVFGFFVTVIGASFFFCSVLMLKLELSHFLGELSHFFVSIVRGQNLRHRKFCVSTFSLLRLRQIVVLTIAGRFWYVSTKFAELATSQVFCWSQ